LSETVTVKAQVWLFPNPSEEKYETIVLPKLKALLLLKVELDIKMGITDPQLSIAVTGANATLAEQTPNEV